MHFVPVVDKANNHISNGGTQAYEQQSPLIGMKVEKEACSNPCDDNSDSKCGTTNQGQFYRSNFSPARRKNRHIGAMRTRFIFTTAKLRKKQLSYPAQQQADNRRNDV